MNDQFSEQGQPHQQPWQRPYQQEWRVLGPLPQAGPRPARWWRRRKVQVAVVLGLVLAVVGGLTAWPSAAGPADFATGTAASRSVTAGDVFHDAEPRDCSNLFSGTALTDHVLDEHVAGAPGAVPTNTVFQDYYDPAEIQELIQDTVEYGEKTPNTPDPQTGQGRDGLVYTMTYEYPIGRTQGADPQTIYTLQVITNPDGSLRTAFPLQGN